MRRILRDASASLITSALALSCGSGTTTFLGDSEGAGQPQVEDGNSSVQSDPDFQPVVGRVQQALRFDRLPRCSRFIDGLVVYVDEPDDQAGLYACAPGTGFFGGSWVQVPIGEGGGGAPGVSIAVDVEDASAADCPQGGHRILTGQDDNRNEVLDADEIDASALVCNGAAGPQGPAGADGADGADGAQGPPSADGAQGPAGADGADGVDGAQGPAGSQGPAGPPGSGSGSGFTSLILVESPPSGACADSGVVVSAGQDVNQNGQLDASEVTSSQTLCDGAQGPAGADGVDGADGADGVDGAQGPAGADGADGVDGAQGPAGADGVDGVDGAQGPAGADGADGSVSLIDTDPASAGQCAFGGIVISTGVDDNDNGQLEPGEVGAVEVVCNGADGVGGGSEFLQPYTFGHADIAFTLELENGEFTPHLHVEGLPQAIVNGHLVVEGSEYDLNSIQIVSPAVFVRPDPDGGFFGPLCVDPGEEVHLLPQSLGGTGGADAQDAPFTGIELDVEPGLVVGDVVEWSLVAVDGPGEHSIWKDGFPPNFAFSTCDGIDASDSVSIPVGHDHWNIGASEPGAYTVTYAVTATLVADGSTVSTQFDVNYLFEEDHE